MPVRVLGFGTYDLTTHPRVGVVLDGLREHGDRVVEVNAPLGFSTEERVAMLGRPWLAYRLILRVLACWAKLTRRSLRARRDGRFDAVVVGYLGHFDVVLARLLFPRTRIVLDLLIFAADTARDRGVTGGLKLRVLDALDRLAVRCADVVMLDTAEHVPLLPQAGQHKVVLVPVGASTEWFVAGEHRSAGASDTLRVVFFGVYTPLQGAAVIGEALAHLADRRDIRVTMIGSGQDYPATREAARSNPHVTWVEWVETSELARMVAAHDVCLGIFGTTPKALRVVPNKVFQGAAAGCVVVTSDTPPQRLMLDSAAAYVPPGDARALAGALVALAGDPARTATLQAAARAKATAGFTAGSVVGPIRAQILGG